jgi:hypothetical protein
MASLERLLGLTRAGVLARLGPPLRIRSRALRYCYTGGGRLLIALDARRRAAMVVTTARTSLPKGAQRGAGLGSLRRSVPAVQRIGHDLYAGPGSVFFGVRANRLRFAGLAARRIRSDGHLLGEYLRLLRL